MNEKAETVLFVDDEENVTSSLSRAMSGEPFSVLCASSAQEGLDVLAEQDVAVVVSDQQMPIMSGAEFLGQVRVRYPSTIRMMLTGESCLGAAIRAINEGEVYRFFSKPCNADELKVAIRQAIEHHKLVELSRQLLHQYNKKVSYIEELETSSPGITHLNTDSGGAILLEDKEVDMSELLKQMEESLKT